MTLNSLLEADTLFIPIGFHFQPLNSFQHKVPPWQVITSLVQWVGPRTRKPFQEITKHSPENPYSTR